MKSAFAYGVGILVSVGAHVALAAFLMLGSRPEPLEASPHASGKIRMEAYEVSETRAKAQENRGEETKSENIAGENLTEGAVRNDRAETVEAPSEIAVAARPQTEKSTLVAPQSDVITATQNSGAAMPALFAQGAVLAAANRPTPVAKTVVVAAETIQPVATQQPVTLASANANADPLAPTAPRPAPVAASPVIGESSDQISPDAPLAEPSAPPVNPIRQTDHNAASIPLENAVLETESLLAVTSFAGNNGAIFDPVSLAAVASFMRPSDTADSADSARDSISQLLSQVPCARIAATFVPETGELELRGHVPDGDMRGPIIDAIRSQLGNSIPVSGSMLVLPEPQCNILNDLEDIGLPQSVDQTNDALQVGASTQLVTLNYNEGQIVEIPIRGSEFASYFYLDFFQIDGNVFHMLPNEHTDLELIEPDATRQIGNDPNGLTLIVQPPFGMELVVAYSSSVPLYEGVRDMVEPSEPYLAFMQERIAILRAEHTDYKGEWVYMFVQTQAAQN